jgi:hypothetical protein
MITYIIIEAVYAVVWLLISPIYLLADATLPQQIADNLAQVGRYTGPMVSILPITDLFSALGIMISIEAAYFAWKLFNWGRKLLPTQS